VVDAVIEPNWLPFFARAVPAIFDAVNASGAVAEGPMSACFPPQVDEAPAEVMAYVSVRGPVLLSPSALAARVTVRELPATDVAVIVHDGPYEALDESYRRLGEWVAANATPRALPVREIYFPDARTEIQWPIEATDD